MPIQCMICHEEDLAESVTLAICQTRPDHRLCQECFQMWKRHPRTQCPICRGPIQMPPPTPWERLNIFFHTYDEDLRYRLSYLVQDRPVRWIIVGLYLCSTYHACHFTFRTLRELYLRYG